MGILSSSLSVARYSVEDSPEQSILETVREGLTQNAMTEIEDEYAELTIGWTPFESPYKADFETYSFIFGHYFLFSMRIDKKSVPAKIVQKHTTMEITKKLQESGRDFLSKNEKNDIKNLIMENLMRRIPSTPNLYDILWDHENSRLFFFTTQKAANEELETLFAKSFKIKLIRLFPFTMIETDKSFTDTEQDRVTLLSSSKFAR